MKEKLKRSFPVCKRCDKFQEQFMVSADNRNEIGYRCALVESEGYFLYHSQLVVTDVPEDCEKMDMQEYENMMNEYTNHSNKMRGLYKSMTGEEPDF